MSLPEFKDARIMIATPHMEYMHGPYVYAALGLIRPMLSEYFFMSFTYLDEARNEAARKLMETQCSHLLFIDSDMKWPSDTLLRLYNHDKDVVGSRYYMRKMPFSPVAYWKNPDGTYRSIENEANGTGLLEIDMIGMGVTLIKRQVIEAFWGTEWCEKHGCGVHGYLKDHNWKTCKCTTCIKKGACNTHALTHRTMKHKVPVAECRQYAPVKITPFKLGLGFGEDTFFCKEAQKLGTKIFVDLDLWTPHMTRAAVRQKVVQSQYQMRLAWEPVD